MRIPRQIAALALVALLALLAAGCGGGDDEAGETTASTTVEEPARPSKAELIEEGDAICAETNAAVGSVLANQVEGEATTASTQVPSLYIGMIEDIQAIGTPLESEGYVEFSQAAEELAKVQGEVKLAAEREDSVALAEAEEAATTAREEFEDQAEVYGFESCGEGPAAPTGAPATGIPGEEGEVEEGGVEPEYVEPEVEEPEYVEPEVEEPAPEEEVAPETGGTGGGTGGGGGGETGGSSGGVGPG
jgi:hypothetical protein